MIYPFSANPSLLSGKPGVTSFRKFSEGSDSELIIWKARSHFLQKIFCSAPNRVARRADQQRAVCQPDRTARAETSSTRPTYASPGSRTRSVAPAYRLFDPG